MPSTSVAVLRPLGGGGLEQRIGEWRAYLRRRQAIQPVDVQELEDHLLDQAAALSDAGLAEDEAFLIAVKRMGDLDSLSREFARGYSERYCQDEAIRGSFPWLRRFLEAR